MKIFNDYEKGFLSAFIDTDGCISINKVKSQSNTNRNRKWQIRIRIRFTNNSIELLNKVQDIIESNKSPHKQSNCKAYDLVYEANDCRWILPQLSLIIKEDKK